jgi:hypothetical protein
MKAIALLCITLFLASCASHGDPQSKLADEFLRCIGDINEKTATENFADKNTRRDVVLESCREFSNRYTIVQEQVYDNACLSAGKDSKACDDDAVHKARQDTDKLIQKASEHIDKTTATRRVYPR